jgi:addiction module RelE/StbE family toxin
MVRKRPHTAEDLHMALKLLSEDTFHVQLRTHKLKGKLAGSWACRVGYDLRVVFSLVEHEGEEAILLETVGTHEEVY